MKKEIEVVVSSQSQKPSTHGKIFAEHWEEKDRIRRGMKWAAMFFGFACIAVLIPGLHFILVPSFLIASPIIGYKMYQQDHAILGGLANCPECQKEITLAASFHRLPVKDVCNHCFCEVTIARLT